jgi:hypothetical protein
MLIAGKQISDVGTADELLFRIAQSIAWESTDPKLTIMEFFSANEHPIVSDFVRNLQSIFPLHEGFNIGNFLRDKLRGWESGNRDLNHYLDRYLWSNNWKISAIIPNSDLVPVLILGNPMAWSNSNFTDIQFHGIIYRISCRWYASLPDANTVGRSVYLWSRLSNELLLQLTKLHMADEDLAHFCVELLKKMKWLISSWIREGNERESLFLLLPFIWLLERRLNGETD